MTNMNHTIAGGRPVRFFILRYLSCLRWPDILALQGPPLLGAVFALRDPGFHDIALLAVLMAGNLLLMTHVFMINDWSGLHGDLRDPNKTARVFTARGVGSGEIAALTIAMLLVGLFFLSRIGVVTLVLGMAIAWLSALYSLPRFHWKGRPLLSSAVHLAGGILHFLLGYSVARAIDLRGLAIAAFFALIFVAGHLTQEIRDCHADAVNAIRTNAVVFGQRRMFVVSLILFALAHIVLLGLIVAGMLPSALGVVVILFPIQFQLSLRTLADGLTYDAVTRLQTKYRVIYAFAGLVMIAVVSALS